MTPRATLGLLAAIFLLGGIILLIFALVEMAGSGHAAIALPGTLGCIMLSIVCSTAFNAFNQVEARLKVLEERLAKFDRGPAAT
jgi:hypothetical protein